MDCCSIQTHYYRDIPVKGDAYADAISDLQKDVTQLQTDVTGLQTEIDTIDNRTIVYISDSYGNYKNENNKSWIDLCIGSVKAVKNYDLHQGGTSFTNWKQMIKDFYNTHTAEENAAITDVVIGGGYNDAFTPEAERDTILTDMQLFAKQVKTHSPKAKMWLIPIGWTPDAIVRERLNIVYEQYYCKAPNYGFSYFPYAYDCLQANNCYEPDAIHPSAIGVNNIATSISSILNGGESIPVAYSLNGAGSSDAFIQTSVSNGVVTFSTTGSFTTTSVTSLNNNAELTVGTINSGAIMGSRNRYYYHFTGYAQFLNGSTLIGYRPVYLTFKCNSVSWISDEKPERKVAPVDIIINNLGEDITGFDRIGLHVSGSAPCFSI